MEPYKNILIIKMSSLGDVLHALPTLHALRQNCPRARIVWAVHENFSALLPEKPFIDDIVYVDKKKLKKLSYWFELRKTLHAYHFDLSIDLQGLAKSAIVAFNSGARKKVGYWEMREGSCLISKGLKGPHAYDHVIERYLDVVRCLGGAVNDVEFPLASIEKERVEVAAKLATLTGGKPYIVVVPGTRRAVKEWPVDYWANFVARVAYSGMYTVLLGSADDEEKGRLIYDGVCFYCKEAGDYVINKIGYTSLKELTAYIEGATLFVSVDTGPLHIANALKKELIALFGPTSPERTGPYGGRNGDYIHLVVSPTSTATTEHPVTDDPECMKAITVDSVWQTYEEVMEKRNDRLN